MPAFSLADDEVDSRRYEPPSLHTEQKMKLKVPRGRSRIQSVLILSMFLAFVTNAIGLTSFQFALGHGISVNAQLAGNLLSGQFPGPLLRVDFSSFLIVGAFLATLLPTLSPIAASLLTLVAMAPPFYIAWAFPVPPRSYRSNIRCCASWCCFRSTYCAVISSKPISGRRSLLCSVNMYRQGLLPRSRVYRKNSQWQVKLAT